MRLTQDKNRPRNPPYLQYLIENQKLKDDRGRWNNICCNPEDGNDGGNLPMVPLLSSLAE